MGHDYKRCKICRIKTKIVTVFLNTKTLIEYDI